MRKAAAVALALLIIAGCGSLRRPAPPAARVALEPALPAGGLLEEGATLEILPFASIPPFDTDRVVTRVAEGRWSLANYHRWLAEPGALVAYHLGEHLGRIDGFAAVFSSPGTYTPAIRVTGAVRALYWDRLRGQAVLEAEFSAARSHAPGGFFRRYRSTVPVETDTVGAYLEAASEGLATVLAEIAEDLARFGDE